MDHCRASRRALLRRNGSQLRLADVSLSLNYSAITSGIIAVIDCGAPKPYHEAIVMNVTDGGRYNSRAYYKCSRMTAQTFGAAPFRYCQADGTWSNANFYCRGKHSNIFTHIGRWLSQNTVIYYPLQLTLTISFQRQHATPIHYPTVVLIRSVNRSSAKRQ